MTWEEGVWSPNEAAETPADDADAPEDDDSWRKQKWARGHRRLALIRTLAENNRTQDQIADEYGISQQSVSQFSIKYREQIEQQRANIDDAFAAIWIAQKQNRVVEYQQLVDDLAEKVAEGDVDPALLRTYATLLRSVAEEMGQLPSRAVVQIGKPQTTYRLAISADELEAL